MYPDVVNIHQVLLIASITVALAECIRRVPWKLKITKNYFQSWLYIGI